MAVRGGARLLVPALVALVMFAPGFFALPAVDRDEAHYAQATRQMLQSGDFVDIRFHDRPWHVKPIGIYWLQALSLRLLGAHPDDAPIWVYRVPSALAAVVAVLATAWIGSMLAGAARGTIAALILAGCLLLGVQARSAMTDAPLLAAITLAQAALLRCYLDERAPRPSGRAVAALYWTAIAAALLIKGPAVLPVSALTLAALCAGERRVVWLRRLRPAWGALILAALVLPWAVAIGVASDGAFYARLLDDSFRGKIFHAHASHGAPPGYHLLSYWFAFWPFSLAGAAGVLWAWRNRGAAAGRFCLAWIVPTWIFYELAVTKLPHYLLPTFPALAVAAACALRAAPQHAAAGRLERAGRAVYASAGLLLSAALLAVPWVVRGTPSLAGFGAALAAALTTAAGWQLFAGPPRVGRYVGTLLAGAWVVYALTYQSLLPHLAELWLAPRVAAAVAAQRRCADAPLYSAGYGEPSLIFELGAETWLGTYAGAAQHLIAHPECGLALVAAPWDEAFGAALRERGRQPLALQTVRGLNYTKNERLALTLYRLAPP